MSAIGKVAAQQHASQQSARSIAKRRCAENVAKAWLEEIAPTAWAIINGWRSDWTRKEVQEIFISASHIADGDPRVLLGQDLHPYSILYCNPSAYDITVAPLGLYDENKQLIQKVPSGGLVRVPIGYTNGGRQSTIACVAPQLKEVPAPTREIMLDLNPQTYSEWITFKDYRSSECCRRAVLWSDAKQALSCSLCHKDVLK